MTMERQRQLAFTKVRDEAVAQRTELVYWVDNEYGYVYTVDADGYAHCKEGYGQTTSRLNQGCPISTSL